MSGACPGCEVAEPASYRWSYGSWVVCLRRQLGAVRCRTPPPRNGTYGSIFLCDAVFRSSSFGCITWGIYQYETPSRRNPDDHRTLATPYGEAHPPAPACGTG